METLFDLDDISSWKEHWNGMPEFEQNDEKPFQQIIISFKTKKDVDAFSKLIKQKLTYKTNGIWFPKRDTEKPSNFLYIDES